METGASKQRWGFWVGVVALVALGMTGPVMAADLEVDNYNTYSVQDSITQVSHQVTVDNYLFLL